MSRFSAGLIRLVKAAMVSAMLLSCPFAVAADSTLPPVRNLAADAASAEQAGMPLIVLVSLAGCPHCEIVRRSHLLPLLRGTVAGPQPVIRQIEVNGRETLLDFNGREITHADFARRYRVKIAPVVFFFDANGEQLAEPLVGSMIPEFYGAYFDAAFNEAKLKLRGERLPTNPAR